MRKVVFNGVQRALLSLLSQNLFLATDDGGKAMESMDFAEVFAEARAQAVPLLAFSRCNELRLSEEQLAEIKGKLMTHTGKNLACFKAHAALHSLLSDAGIDYCILKGAASARYYPDPLIRCMGDVDFYVRPDDVKKTEELLVSAGFVRQDAEHHYHVGFKSREVSIEMHFDPIAPDNEAVRDTFRGYWSDLIDRSQLVDDGFGKYRVPSDFHHGFIMLCHVENHLIAEGIGLRHLCDWAVFANSFSNGEFIDTFEADLRRVGLWRLAQLLSLAAVEHLGMPYREWMGDDVQTANELLFDIFDGGNFGRKISHRAYDGFFISSYGKDGMDDSRLRQVTRAINRRIADRFPSVKKFPVLYPFGWVWFFSRQAFLFIFGKRRLNVAKTYTRSGRRKKLYKKIRLLEPEVKD